MDFLFYIMAKSHNLTSNFTKFLGVALNKQKIEINIRSTLFGYGFANVMSPS